MNNEEMLLPFFIIQHAPMFDKVILIDFDSTDSSVSIVEKYAPPSWQVVQSSTGAVFDARRTDNQVMYWEKQNSDHWAIALTITEFLIFPNFRESLRQMHPFNNIARFDKDDKVIYVFHAANMVGSDAAPLKYFSSLPEQRHQFLSTGQNYHRFFHKGTSETHGYGAGRHSYDGKDVEQQENLNGFIMKWLWTPWPESADRKMNVGGHIPEDDKALGLGAQHFSLFSTREDIENVHSSFLADTNLLHDLCNDDDDNQFLWLRRVFHSAFGKACYP
jgi:hypothetical protein